MSFLTEGKVSLYIFASNQKELHIKKQSFIVLEPLENKKIIPAIGVRDILIFGDLTISSATYKLAEKHKIPIHFLTGRGRFIGSCLYGFSKNVFLRFEQYQNHIDMDKRLYIASQFIQAKIYNTNRFLKRYKVDKVLQLTNSVKDLDSLRGVEGANARAYFHEWKHGNIILSDVFVFHGRSKRPPKDEINALLSLSYTMLHNEILSQLQIIGLDPYIGYLHDQRYGHAALASDVQEVFRSIVDHFVVKIINRKELLPDDFMVEDTGAVVLTSDGKSKFFPKWARFIREEKVFDGKSLISIIERDIRQLFCFFMDGLEQLEFYRWPLR